MNDIAVRINTLIFNFLFSQSITDLHTEQKLSKVNFEIIRFKLSKIWIRDKYKFTNRKNKYIYEYGISYVERSKEDGKK